jgi:GAF domain-containing protein
VLSVLFAAPRALTGSDATDLAAFAQLAALTLERGQLEHELERRELLRAGFVEIAETLSGSREPTETYGAVAAAARRALRARGAVVATGVDDLHAVGAVPSEPALVDEEGRAGALLSLAAREGRIVLCADVAADGRIPLAERHRLVESGQRSALCLPIGSHDDGRPRPSSASSGTRPTRRPTTTWSWRATSPPRRRRPSSGPRCSPPRASASSARATCSGSPT